MTALVSIFSPTSKNLNFLSCLPSIGFLASSLIKFTFLGILGFTARINELNFQDSMHYWALLPMQSQTPPTWNAFCLLFFSMSSCSLCWASVSSVDIRELRSPRACRINCLLCSLVSNMTAWQESFMTSSWSWNEWISSWRFCSWGGEKYAGKLLYLQMICGERLLDQLQIYLGPIS